jgi:hypothetical protein
MWIACLARRVCGIYVALCNEIMNIKPPPMPSFDVPKRPVVRPSGIVAPRGDIVLSTRRRPVVPRPRVTIAGPGLRPDATAVRIEAARSALQALTEARDGFVERAAAARERVRTAPDERTRVTAMSETYRAEAALDDVLRRTLNEVTALMEERGLR